MKIVYSILGTFNSGGMERVLTNKANYFAELGYDITIITTDQKQRKPYFELDSRVKCIDLAINYTDIVTSVFLKKLFLYHQKQKQHYQLLNQLLISMRADIVISMFDNDSNFLYKIKDGSKKILEIHFSKFKRLQYHRDGMLKWVDNYKSKQDVHAVKQYDKFVVLTNEDKAYWGDLDNICVIPNANTFESESRAILHKKQVIAVGRYDFQKNFEDLIRAWALLPEKRGDWKLNIYGHGDLRASYQELIAKLNLKQQVFLCPPTDKIKEAYLNHSFVVMSSRYEGLPMVLLEAQACGLPLISYACKCGPKDIIIEGENGFLIPEGNIPVLADRIARLMCEEDLRQQMGAKAKKLSIRFSEEPIMNQWIQVFNELIK